MKANGDGPVAEYDDVEITFQQLTTSYKAELISCTFRLEFIEQLWEQLNEITSNFFCCKITILVSKQTKKISRFCRKLLQISLEICRKRSPDSTR